MIKKLLAGIALFYGLCSNAQGTWTQKTDFGGAGKQQAVGFSIGNFGYVGLGYEANPGYPTDFWQYNPGADTWTAKANFTGGARWASVGFSIGNFGYVSTGFRSAPNTFYSDLWQYDPLLDTWTAKANFPGAGRWYGVGFSVGSKGYVGLGYNSLTSTFFSDLWEYDPSNDTWAAMANFPGTKNLASSFTIGNKAYVVGGSSSTAVLCSGELWEFDPGANTWTQKASYPGTPCSKMVSFTIGNYGYAGTGKVSGSANVTQDFYRYDPFSDMWSPVTFFNGQARWLAVGFGIGNKGYVCTGSNASPSPIGDLKDLWVYSLPCLPPALVISATAFNLCAGESATVSVSGATTYSWNNGSTSSSIAVTPTVNAIYTATGSVGFGCTNSATITLSVAPCTGFSNQSASQNWLQVFPTPSQGNIHVKSSQTINRIEVLNTLGQIIYTARPNSQVYSFEIEDYGLHYLKVYSGDQEITRIIILQNGR